MRKQKGPASLSWHFLFRLGLQFVWPISKLKGKLSILNQYGTLLCFSPLLYCSQFCPCFVNLVWLRTVVKKELLVLDRNVCFRARPCHGKNTQKHKKLTASPHGMTVVKRLQGIWLACWKKKFPTGLTIKRTVCCKSPRPYAIIESRMELWNWPTKVSVLLNMEYRGIHC